MSLKRAPFVVSSPGALFIDDKTPMDLSTTFELIAELLRGRTKFPGSRFMLAALVEEVGELAEAIFAGNAKAIREEAVQVAAVAIRIAEEGDDTTYDGNGFVLLVHHFGELARAFVQKRKTGGPLDVIGRLVGRLKECGDKTFADMTDEEAKP